MALSLFVYSRLLDADGEIHAAFEMFSYGY